MNINLEKNIADVFKKFESKARSDNESVEFWFARDLQKLLEYENWDNFLNVIKKGMSSCKLSGQNVVDHFMVISTNIARCKDYKLTRYAFI
ncbi:hypothetical protein GUI12_00150 [Anaplasmataceae bacterium AB001_6]|nr:hypothetical protein GUI12_00150 [Anaplasmataceae bacterium AB001_6]